MKKQVKKWLAVLACIMLTAVLFSGCSGSSSNNNDDSGDQVLIIGGIGPLSGEYANYGLSVRGGAQIAVDEINAAGGVNGIKLELKFEDSKGDSAEAVTAYGKLMDDGMKVSLGGVFSGPCIAVTEEANAQEDGILMITPSGSAKECTQYYNNFRVCFNDPQQGTVAATYIKKNLGKTKVAILYESSNAYSAGIVEKFEQQSPAEGIEIVTKQAFTDQSNVDFGAQLLAIKNSGAELIFLPIYAQEAANILRQAKDAGITIPFFGCDGLDGVVGKLGDDAALAEGVMLLTPFVADATDAKTQAFVSTYKAKNNGAVPDQFAADGYDAIYAIKAALEKANVTDVNSLTAKTLGEKLIPVMTQITVEGVTGTMTWTADGETSKEAKGMKIQNGVYVALD